MSQDNKKSFVMYQGDGSNNVFSVPMTKGKYGTISVAFVRRGLDQYEYNPDTWGLNGGLFAWDLSGTKVYTDTATPAIGATVYDQYGVDTGDTVTAVGGATITVNTNVYTRDTLHDVDENTVLTWTGDALQIGDYIVIERTTTRTQPFEFQNNQKHIEKSDDNLERQIQEVADKVDNALLVDPTHTIDSNKMNPVEWMQTILRSVDKSVRGFRYLNGWLDYSLDDPNVADADKTWVHLLNTDNIKAVRERSEIVDDETIYWTEYQASDGTWRTLANTSEWDRKIQDAVDTADEAKSVADDAKDIAQDAKDIVDSFDDRLTQAEQDASDAKDIAQDASDVVSAHITDTGNPHSVTKAQVGLGNVDNTSDADKPISTATQDALDLKADSADLGTAAYTDSTDYATAAQGTKSDSALQPGDNVSELVNDTGFITKVVNDLQNYTLTSDLATVATSGSYNDLIDKPTISTTLAGLTGDVSISSPSGGEHLVYDAVAGKWKNTPSAATVSWGGVAGDINNQSDLMALFATKADISVTYTKTEVDNLLVGKADVATTLAGYGITDAYTTTQVDNLLVNKANVALDNLTSAGKSFIAHAGMPNMSAGVALSGLDSYQQITEDGWIHIISSGGGSWDDVGVYYSVNGSTDVMQFIFAALYSNQMFLPVPKNIYIKRYNNKTTQIVFYPCIKG